MFSDLDTRKGIFEDETKNEPQASNFGMDRQFLDFGLGKENGDDRFAKYLPGLLK